MKVDPRNLASIGMHATFAGRGARSVLVLVVFLAIVFSWLVAARLTFAAFA